MTQAVGNKSRVTKRKRRFTLKLIKDLTIILIVMVAFYGTPAALTVLFDKAVKGDFNGFIASREDKRDVRHVYEVSRGSMHLPQ